MATGIWIILHDGFGMGLNLINPRLYTDSKGNNWFKIEKENGVDNNDRNEIELMEKLGIRTLNYIIVRG